MSDHLLSVPFFIINTMIVLLSFKSVMTHYLLSYLRNTSLLKQSNMNLINQRVMQRSGLTLNSCVLQQWEKQYTKVQQINCPAVFLLKVMTCCLGCAPGNGSNIIPNYDTLTKSFYLLGTNFLKMYCHNVSLLNNKITSIYLTIK